MLSDWRYVNILAKIQIIRTEIYYYNKIIPPSTVDGRQRLFGTAYFFLSGGSQADFAEISMPRNRTLNKYPDNKCNAHALNPAPKQLATSHINNIYNFVILILPILFSYPNTSVRSIFDLRNIRKCTQRFIRYACVRARARICVCACVHGVPWAESKSSIVNISPLWEREQEVTVGRSEGTARRG